MTDNQNQDNLDTTTQSNQDMSKLGQKGGKAQQSGTPHELTEEERSRGGQNSSRSPEDLDEL